MMKLRLRLPGQPLEARQGCCCHPCGPEKHNSWETARSAFCDSRTWQLLIASSFQRWRHGQRVTYHPVVCVSACGTIYKWEEGCVTGRGREGARSNWSKQRKQSTSICFAHSSCLIEYADGVGSLHNQYVSSLQIVEVHGGMEGSEPSHLRISHSTSWWQQPARAARYNQQWCVRKLWQTLERGAQHHTPHPQHAYVTVLLTFCWSMMSHTPPPAARSTCRRLRWLWSWLARAAWCNTVSPWCCTMWARCR